MINHQYVNDPEISKLFKHIQALTGIKRATLLIVKQPKVNAMTNMVTHSIRITTLDLKIFNHDDVKALLGHEFGHLLAQKQPHYWFYTVAIFGAAIIISFFNFTVSNPILNFLLSIIQIVIDIVILMFFMSFYARPAEARADRFSAKLVGASNMIHLLSVMYDYKVNEIKQAEIMTDELKTVPTAYLECKTLLLWHRTLLWLNQHNLGIHPSFKKRIRNLQSIKK